MFERRSLKVNKCVCNQGNDSVMEGLMTCNLHGGGEKHEVAE